MLDVERRISEKCLESPVREVKMFKVPFFHITGNIDTTVASIVAVVADPSTLITGNIK